MTPGEGEAPDPRGDAHAKAWGDAQALVAKLVQDEAVKVLATPEGIALLSLLLPVLQDPIARDDVAEALETDPPPVTITVRARTEKLPDGTTMGVFDGWAIAGAICEQMPPSLLLRLTNTAWRGLALRAGKGSRAAAVSVVLEALKYLHADGSDDGQARLKSMATPARATLEKRHVPHVDLNSPRENITHISHYAGNILDAHGGDLGAFLGNPRCIEVVVRDIVLVFPEFSERATHEGTGALARQATADLTLANVRGSFAKLSRDDVAREIVRAAAKACGADTAWLSNAFRSPRG